MALNDKDLVEALISYVTKNREEINALKTQVKTLQDFHDRFATKTVTFNDVEYQILYLKDVDENSES